MAKPISFGKVAELHALKPVRVEGMDEHEQKSTVSLGEDLGGNAPL